MVLGFGGILISLSHADKLANVRSVTTLLKLLLPDCLSRCEPPLGPVNFLKAVELCGIQGGVRLGLGGG